MKFQKGHKVNLGKKNSLGKHWKLSEETKRKMSVARKGTRVNKKHPLWKGDEVGYGALHSWIHRNLGKAKKCQYKFCQYPRKTPNNRILFSPKRFNWANVSHEYKRDFSDWIQLCASCHARYDRGFIEL